MTTKVTPEYIFATLADNTTPYNSCFNLKLRLLLESNLHQRKP